MVGRCPSAGQGSGIDPAGREHFPGYAPGNAHGQGGCKADQGHARWSAARQASNPDGLTMRTVTIKDPSLILSPLDYGSTFGVFDPRSQDREEFAVAETL